MAKEIAISVKDVRKTFKLPHERYSSLKQNAMHVFSKRTYSQFKAVQGVGFEVKKGEFFGIVGRNGCGKSTLLKMLAGIYVPSQGSIHINGSLSPFIELGVGFNPELTARENVFLNGAILGLKRKEIEARFDEIMSFAELEGFIDQKLKNFSSGMQVRLAFSIAIQAQSEILLVDEVLAVGDSSFQKKCFDVFRKLKREGRTIVFVTHDMSNVQEFCDRVLVMQEGKQLGVYGPDQAIDIYQQLNAENSLDQLENLDEKERWGSNKVTITSVRLFDGKGKENHIFKTGEPLKIRIETESKLGDKEQLQVGLAFVTSDGTHIAGPNNGTTIITAADKHITFDLDKVPLIEGSYQLTVAIFNKPGTETYDYIKEGFSFAVTGLKREYGLVAMFGSWTVDRG